MKSRPGNNGGRARRGAPAQEPLTGGIPLPTARTALARRARQRARHASGLFQIDGSPAGADPTTGRTPLTPRVLDMLRVRRAGHLLRSARGAGHPELIARQVAEDEVGVHNWCTRMSTGVTFLRAERLVDRTCEAIVAAGGPSPRLWRPPYGRVDAPAMMAASPRGWTRCCGSVHTHRRRPPRLSRTLSWRRIAVLLCMQPRAPVLPWKEACAHC